MGRKGGLAGQGIGRGSSVWDSHVVWGQPGPSQHEDSCLFFSITRRKSMTIS